MKIIHVNYDMKLFTFAENCFRGFKHIKHCFLVILLFRCLSVYDFVCVQLDTGLEIFQLISGQNVCHYLGGDKGGGGKGKR